jgi:DNA-binding transcriptional LysR family regulator
MHKIVPVRVYVKYKIFNVCIYNLYARCYTGFESEATVTTPINFNHFYYFYEVARHGSFTAAARDLMISQSALSIQIKSFEESLGRAMFDRTKAGIQLTDAGQAAYQVAERVFQDVDQLISDLRESERQFTGAVSVATVNSIGIYVLPEVLSAFREALPEVEVRIDFKDAEAVIELVESGRVDFAIIPWQSRYPGLVGLPLQAVKMFLVATPDHPLAGRRSVHPRDLEKYPFVGYERRLHTRSMTDALFKRMAIDVHYAIESANAATIKHMAMAGMGLAIVPEYAVAGELRRSQLVRIEVPAMTISQELTVYMRKNRTLSPTGTHFLSFLQEYFKPHTHRRREVREAQ